jgi:uncharacterized protein (DUF433 family)
MARATRVDVLFEVMRVDTAAGEAMSVGALLRRWRTTRRLSQLDLALAAEVSPLSGAPVFRGTRVPVQTLLDHLEAGETLDAFLADFPTVRREQAIQFLELAGKAALAPLSANPSR